MQLLSDIVLIYPGSRLPTIETSPNDVHSFKGEDILLQCEVDQFADSVFWEKDGVRIESTRISMLPSGLIIRRATIEDTGTYTCVAENDAGRTTASAFVNVTGDLLSCSGRSHTKLILFHERYTPPLSIC